jgi:hypothetical protein
VDASSITVLADNREFASTDAVEPDDDVLCPIDALSG